MTGFTGEPGAVKAARPVRRGVAGKVPSIRRQDPDGTTSAGANRYADDRRQLADCLLYPEVIWSTLDRDPQSYQKVLSDYEEGAVGLRVAEIKEVIDHEKSFQSSSGNLSPQIQQIVGNLRYMGLLGRNETDKRYFIVEGAELYGPPLNEDGTPMDEQEDGTFKKADGSIFKWPDKSPVKKRQKREKRAS